jgi:hypothetical protein
VENNPVYNFLLNGLGGYIQHEDVQRSESHLHPFAKAQQPYHPLSLPSLNTWRKEALSHQEGTRFGGSGLRLNEAVRSSHLLFTGVKMVKIGVTSGKRTSYVPRLEVFRLTRGSRHRRGAVLWET